MVVGFLIILTILLKEMKMKIIKANYLVNLGMDLYGRREIQI